MNRDYNRIWPSRSNYLRSSGKNTSYAMTEDDREKAHIDVSDDQLGVPEADGIDLLDDDREHDDDGIAGTAGSSCRNGSNTESAGGGSGGIKWGRVGKVAVAVGALVAIGIVPTKRLVASESAQAVVNARVVTVRAPIDGELWWSAGFHIGTALTRGQIMMVVNNPRAETGPLDAIRRELLRLDAEMGTLSGKIEAAKQERISLLSADQLHRSARLRQFRARKDQVIAQISVATANEANAESSLKRTAWLASRGLSTRALLENKHRDSEVASRSVMVLQHQLRQIEVELDAALKGIRLTDDHNALSHMKTRAQQISYEVQAWELQLGSLEKLIEQLNADLGREKQRLSEKQRVIVSAPADGRVWEVLAASGELVQRGQPLFRLLDCTGALVSTSVSEATYNRLRVDGTATFRSSSDLTEYRGHIVTMHGLAAPPANLAIETAQLRNEPFRVGVYVPDLVKEGTCTVGQTGIVKFDEGAGDGFVRRMRHWFNYWLHVS